MQIKRYLANSSAISKTQGGIETPRVVVTAHREGPFVSDVRSRSVSAIIFNLFSRKPAKTQYRVQARVAWRFNGRPATPC